jgi:hypothetical protein
VETKLVGLTGRNLFCVSYHNYYNFYIKIKWADHVERMGTVDEFVQGSVGKTERQRLTGRPGHRWHDNKTVSNRLAV